MRRSATLALFLSVAAATLTGCSASSMSQADVEKQISDQLTEQVGQKPDKVTCPGDLKAEEGETMTCVLEAGEDSIDVDLEVTKVKDGTASFDIQVADEVN
jgi:hypothetical protein